MATKRMEKGGNDTPSPRVPQPMVTPAPGATGPSRAPPGLVNWVSLLNHIHLPNDLILGTSYSPLAYKVECWGTGFPQQQHLARAPL